MNLTSRIMLQEEATPAGVAGAAPPGGAIEGAAAESVGGVSEALRIAGVAKSFHGKTVLHPFEMRVGRGEIHMLLGQNGSGKSTLIKVLSGLHKPDPGGEVTVAGRPLTFGDSRSSRRLGLRFVHQDLGLIEDATIEDNLAMGTGYPTRCASIRARRMRHRARAQLAGVGLDLDPRTKVSALSAAQRTGVAVARALDAGGDRAEVIVLDEPTATLPTDEVEHLHDMLRAAAADGLAIIYVTHHLEEVYDLGTHVHVLRDGRLVHSSPVAEIEHDGLVHALVGGELEAVARAAATLEASPSDVRALSVRGLHSELVKGVDLDVAAGEVVGIYGLTGSGRESILGALFGGRPRSEGTVWVNGTTIPPYRPTASIAAGMGYVPPDRKAHGALMELSAAENLMITDVRSLWSRGWMRKTAERRRTDEWLDKLDVRPRNSSRNPLNSFSGGNQQKIVIGKWLRLAPGVLLLDEPTQGVDVGAKAGLHRLVLEARAAGAAVVISSTDVGELATLSDRVLIMRDGKVADELRGDDVSESSINRSFHATTTTATKAE